MKFHEAIENINNWLNDSNQQKSTMPTLSYKLHGTLEMLACILIVLYLSDIFLFNFFNLLHHER